ncbi:DarT ssDNA thymidine ADP-ribosyltransferase family protein [uncultured Devosia sp.]|uniref:DarT ssDNA thymidine ADP-ribosyltransferase family protein n=1 Tax=uncultured Devosia sp. TaxID=211434 RepID=UPI00262903B2|nr:DarT ssDNA thymidine ADP-ribosyltransferase family protein [uncultured Devosia sp.]
MWASHLFHACQLEVAVAILRGGALRCRNGAGELLCDVANQGALWNNPVAHNYARLYFRPRNSFHLKTEGIKRIGDPYRVDPHMSIPIMLAFDFKKILTLPSSGFLYGNFAHLGAQVQSGDPAFDQLDFFKIYHDAPPATDGDAIREARMSEVVVEHEVSTNLLNAVVCRTVQDLATLKHSLGDFVPSVPLIVERQSNIFQRRSIYIRELYYDAGCLHFLLTYPHSGGLQGLKLRVASDLFDRTYTVDTNRFQIECPGADPSTVWAIYIEDCMAYYAPVPWESGLV